ncbi:oligoendopeptidase F [Lactococcus termiticola]|uniref:Oligopeptidase F n=1 Tax=Lactococcus termiticola TaxID=2169526 RepID=A0A2R5HD33_9LACT|nr:oligoendopeptidase F [Lactococcus termiticola]GBG95922.1 oligoendopeptidase F [Lactococcus termiticola]
MPKARAEIDESLKWDLTSIFKEDQDFEAALEAVKKRLPELQAFQGRLSESGSMLLSATELEMELSQEIEKIYVYASMKNDEDTRLAKYQEYQSKATSLYADFATATAYFEPELLAFPDGLFEDFLTDETGLKLYEHYFERLFTKKAHVLSQKEEELLATASEIFEQSSSTFEVFDNADIKLPEVENEAGEKLQLSHGNYISLMESKDRKVRKQAYEALYSNYQQYQHTYAKTLEGNVKVQNFKAKSRHYSSARRASLSGNFIPEQVYDVLLEVVNDKLGLLHRYIGLRKEILGLDDLRMYDIYVPLTETDYKFNYQEGVEKAEEVLAQLGEDYLAKVKRAFADRWIDVEENAGKRSGAYSGGSYDTNAFILLNWQETLDDLFTLVHEMGHSMHSAYSRESQPYVYGDYPIFLAEIASTTNENLLTEKLLAEARAEGDEDKEFALLNHWLDSFRGTVYRQTQFAEFEQIIHEADWEGEVLTSDFMNQAYAKLNEKYYGLSASDNPEIQYEWARIPHFYYNFYVFQYATGFAAATALAEKLLYGDATDLEAYLAYLKAGSSAYPLEVMAAAGVDMTSSSYLESAFELFEKRLDRFEALVKKGVYGRG